ncbi:glycoside hydrolase [Panus rudis PR-1116 ss-1]|nr:glycoside hydrolase [Panus rudis PR-1116 ss-1]
MCRLRSSTGSSNSVSGATSSTAPGSGTTGGSANNTNSNNLVSMTWYAGWHGGDQYFPLKDVSWNKYTHITYSFAVTTPDVNTVSLADSDEELLPQFVQQAQQNGVKALVTVGGWTGSQYFSTAVGSEENRTAFVKTMVNLVNQYNLDGLDFDWEYPGKQGMGCNMIDEANDSSNFLSFLQALRATPEFKNRTITAAASLTPFAANGQPMSDVSAFAKVLDWVAIMNYDVSGTWSNGVGPNAPLNDTCAPPDQQQGSAVSAVKAWTDAGMPSNQLVLGVASYGHTFSVPQSDAFSSSSTDPSTNSAAAQQPSGTKLIAAYPQFNKAAAQPQGDEWDVSSPPGVDQCGNQSTGGFSGVFDFFGLIDAGYLDGNGTVNGNMGLGFRFDECSQTPYVYDPQKQIMVSYDDPKSFAAKGKFIVDSGLRGFAMWEAAGDKNDLLLDSIRSSMGV